MEDKPALPMPHVDGDGGLRRIAATIAVVLTAAIISGCATQSYQHTDSVLPELAHPPIVLLMRPDVELSELTAGGLLQPHALWTRTGTANVEQALADLLKDRQAAMVPYQPPDDSALLYRDDQIVKLHRVVGDSILMHKYLEPLLLPTKTEVFDWSLGPDVQSLAADHRADYALFVFLRDSYATAGRQAMIVAMAVLGVGIPAGTQAGFASLVDLRTGNVIWFNRLVSATGDLRTPQPAGAAVDSLLTGLPL